MNQFGEAEHPQCGNNHDHTGKDKQSSVHLHAQTHECPDTAENHPQNDVGTDTSDIVGAVTDELRPFAHGCIDFSGAVGDDKAAAHPDAMTETSGKSNRNYEPPLY